jgi:CheY-like chemotaxis protein
MRSVQVLVVDDNADHRYLITRALRDDTGVDVRVDAVADGEEMLDYLHRRGTFADRPRPHVIFLDLRMPRLDGFEALERVKADPAVASIPVVVLTSSDRREDVDRAYATGSNAYLTKPRRLPTLRAELRDLTSYWTTRAELPGLP